MTQKPAAGTGIGNKAAGEQCYGAYDECVIYAQNSCFYYAPEQQYCVPAFFTKDAKATYCYPTIEGCVKIYGEECLAVKGQYCEKDYKAYKSGNDGHCIAEGSNAKEICSVFCGKTCGHNSSYGFCCNSLNVWLICGIAAGVCVLLIIIALLVVFACRSHRQKTIIAELDSNANMQIRKYNHKKGHLQVPVKKDTVDIALTDQPSEKGRGLQPIGYSKRSKEEYTNDQH